ncbi:helix-turn-helix transcriptional regulator [Streptomyces sp. NBC_00825]|uniref:helix-turn-helix domain-containing protein n=1 Tax=unclassified Streptomyces TaxID=2593676 RepID=UPI002ED2DF0A|nr:helix-turn-helix transcriptional regulator [Streptomyces sp. NBC_00826]WTH88188.1 helix-turn-helix transcriptional regulator [Streptomyces sp. NBC_00825]WTH96916.1 helix-turn-helix transcriptional regulator [Streptomyces sp. NBC_00822]
MTPKLDYRWHLREVMATRGMFSTTDLRPLLAERGIDLSPSQTYRLVVERPERLSLKTLMALLDILGCTMNELIEPVAAAGSRRRHSAAVGGGLAPGKDTGLGDLRPKRARIVPE